MNALLRTADFDLTSDFAGEAAELEDNARYAAYLAWCADRSDADEAQAFADFLIANALFYAFEAWDMANNCKSFGP